MEKQKMTIHSALAELKLLDSRIREKTDHLHCCYANKHSNTKINGAPIKEVVADQAALYQSISDLIQRRVAIKKAVVLSNAQTYVTIGGENYTVAEAIEMKQSSIGLYHRLYAQITTVYAQAQNTCSNANIQLQDKADVYIASLFGGDTKGVSPKTIEDAKAAYVTENQYELVEAIPCQKIIDALEEKLDKFETEVDAALSVSNAITYIEI